MALLLVKLCGFAMQDALAMPCGTAEEWLECVQQMEKAQRK